MRIDEDFVSEVENFLDVIENEDQSTELAEAIEVLRIDLNSNRYVSVEMLQDYLGEIWDLISTEEKRTNGFLEIQYDRLMDDYAESCEEDPWD